MRRDAGNWVGNSENETVKTMKLITGAMRRCGERWYDEMLMLHVRHRVMYRLNRDDVFRQMSETHRPAYEQPAQNWLYRWASLVQFSYTADTSTAAVNTLCLRKKNATLFIFLIIYSDVIQFCQFLIKTYPMEFKTNTNAQLTTSPLICS